MVNPLLIQGIRTQHRPPAPGIATRGFAFVLASRCWLILAAAPVVHADTASSATTTAAADVHLDIVGSANRTSAEYNARFNVVTPTTAETASPSQ